VLSIRARMCFVACLFLPSGAVRAQDPPSFAYVESFRKGPTRIQEQTFQLDLDPKNTTCAIRVKDASGRNRYLFSCVPQTSGPGDNRIIAWHVRLEDLKHSIYPNVLMASPDPMQDQTQIGWLDPKKFAKIALNVERVAKVDQFYCVFRVLDSHFAASGQQYLDHMVIEVRFTNTMPHSEIRGAQ
jgi:hypothetical protein